MLSRTTLVLAAPSKVRLFRRNARSAHGLRSCATRRLLLPRITFRGLVLLLSAASLHSVLSGARADTTESIWNGSSSIVWGTSGNWSNGLPSSTVSAEFTSATPFANQPQLQATTAAEGIWVTGSTSMGLTTISSSGAFGLTITGDATLDGIANAGILLDGTGNNSLTIANSLTGGVTTTNSTSFLVNDLGTLTIAAPLTVSTGTTLTLGSSTASGAGTIVISGVIQNTTGSLVINDTAGTTAVTLSGANLYTGGTTLTAGTLNFNNASAIGTGTLIINGGTLNNSTGAAITNSKNNAQTWGGNFAFTGTQSLNLGTGAVTMTGPRTITVNANTLTVGGAISGATFGLTKAGNGTLAISGIIGTTTGSITNSAGTLSLTGANTFSGGMTINAGFVRLGTSGTAGGTGMITVNNGGTLVGASANTFTSPITLNTGATLGDSAGATFSGAVTVSGNSTIRTADPQNTATTNDVIITGTFSGNGNLNVIPGTNVNSVDGGSGLRLRSATNQTYSGTITFNNNVKAELQSAATGTIMPAGTATIVMTGGLVARDGTANSGSTTGGYSELILRNNSTGNTAFGNNMQMTGSGVAILNALGTANPTGSTASVTMGNLTIGSNQELGLYNSGSGPHTVVFPTVTLTGNATFSPRTAGFNTATQLANLSLGTITEQTSGSSITMFGIDTLFLTGNNTFTGGLNITSILPAGNTTDPGGIVQLMNTGALNATTPQAVTFGANTTGELRLNGLSNTTGSLATNAAVGTPVVDNVSATAAALTINTAGTSNFGGVLRDGAGGGALSLIKTGAGIQTLSGANTYTGTTAVNGGTLRLSTAGTNNIATSPTISVGGSGTLDVTAVNGGAGLTLAGTQVLANNGTVSGNVTATTGTIQGTGNYAGGVTISGGTLSPGNSLGTLNTSSLSMNSGTWRVEINGAANDVVNVANAANFTGGGITLSLLGAPTAPFYDILTSGSLSGLPIINNPTIGRSTFSFDPSPPPNTIRLDVVGVPASLIWNNAGGTGDGMTWENAQTQQNWRNGGTPDFFYDGDNVTFSDANNNHYSVTVNGTVSPGSIIVNNSSGDYTISGGTIAGVGSLTKNGTSTLTISTSGTYSGGTILNAGTLNLANAGALGSGTITINGGALDNTSGAALTLTPNDAQVWGGSFTFLGAADGSHDLNLGTGAVTLNSNPTVTVNNGTLTVGGIIANGSGNAITKAGAGQFTLSGANTFSGGLTINAGALRLGNASAAGGASGGTVLINSGGTLIGGTNAAITVATPINLAGGTLGGNSGPTFSGNVTVTSASTVLIADPITPATNSDVIITGTLLGSGNLNVLTGGNQINPDGGNGFRLRGAGASTYSGTITLNNNVKGEVQTSVVGPFSPAGSGNIVMVAGDAALNNSPNAGTLAGGYSELNIRNLLASGTATIGTNISVTGAGLVVLNLPSAPGGLRTVMGSLRVGDGEEVAAWKSTTTGTPQTLEFTSATLTGGTVTLSPKKVGFGAANADGADLVLDTVSETSPTAVVMGGARTLFLSGNDTFTGGLTINTGTVQLGNPGALNSTTPNAVTLNGGGAVTPRLQLNGNSVTINGLNSTGGGGATTAIVENGNATTAATLTVDSTNNPTFDGTLQNGAAASLSLAQIGAGTFTLTGSSTYTGSTTVAAGGTLRIGNGGTSGALTGTSGISGGAGSLLTFNRSNGLTLAAPITGSIAVTQAGSGTTTLTGTSNFSGDTNINNGTLIVNGALGAGSAVKVNAFTTLAGTGSVGNVTTASFSSVRPGATAADLSAGMLSMNSLLVNGGDYRVDVGGDQINVAGLAHYAAASTISPATNVTPGVYTVLTAGTLTIDPGQAPTVDQVSGARETFSLDLTTPNTIKLDVVGAAANLTWKGNIDAGGGTFFWDVQGTKNWINTSSGNIADFFFNGDNVTFDDTGVNKAVTIVGSVAPGSVTVNNSTGNDYTFISGSIDGFSSLVKSGTGALTLTNSSTYSGGTILNAGTLNANAFNALGAGAVTVNGGTLNLGNSNAVGSGTLTINGGVIDNTSGNVFTLSANNAQVWGGSFTFVGTSDLNLGTGAVIMNASPTITVNAGNLIVGGTISDGVAGFGLTKAGEGTLELDSTSNTFRGATTVNGGTLIIARDGTLGTPPATVNPAAITLNGGALQVNNGTAANSGAGNVTLATNRGITLGATGGTLSIGFVDPTTGNHLNNETALVYNGVITGPGGLTVVGQSGIVAPSSILDLSAVATYQGNTTISNAIVQVNAGNTGTNNGAAVANILPTGTTLNLINSGAWNIDSGASSLTVAGLNGDATSKFGTTNASTAVSLTLAGAGSYAFPGLIGAMTVAGKPGVDAELRLVKSGSGTQVLSGANSYAGTTTISGGVLSTPLLAIGGSPSGIGSSSNAATNLVINGGTLQYTGGDTSTDRNFTIGAPGATLDSSGATNGALNMSNTAAVAFSATTSPVALTLTGSSTGANTLAGIIGNPGTGANITTLNKSGVGTWFLSGSNTYSGNTNVNAGTLGLAGGSTNNIPGSPRISLGSGATLDVNGLSAGTLVLGNGTISQTLAAPAPSVSGPPNLATVAGSLEIKSGSVIAGGSGSNLTVSGAVTLDSGSLASFALGTPNGTGNATTAFVNINGAGGLTVAGTHTLNLSGSAQAGTYELYAFTAGTPTANQFQIGSSPSGFLYSFSVTPNQEVDLTVQVAPILVWTGTVNNTWDIATANWNSQAGLFANGDGAQFDDTNTSGHNTIAIDAAGVISAKVVFANSTEDYSINGPGAISGTGGFNKSGSGTVTINVTNNTNAGASTITSGTLAIAGDGSLGAAPGAAVANQLTINGGQLSLLGTMTLSPNRGIQIGNAAGMIGANAATGGTINVVAGVTTYNGIVANVTGQAGILTKAGPGELDLGGVNTYSGGTVINAGVLGFANDANLGAVPASAQAANLTLNGGTSRASAGTAANAGAGNATINTNRGITLGASSGTIAIGFTDPTTGAAHNGAEIALVYSGVVTGPGGLTITGLAGVNASPTTDQASSIFDLGAVATYQGDTTISNAVGEVNSGTTGPNNGAAIVNILPTGTALNLINSGAWNLSSGSSNLTVAGLNGDATGRLGTTNATAAVVLTLGGSGNYSFPGIVGAFTVYGKTGDNGHLSLVKSGSGTQVFSGANTYAGGTTVNNGTLTAAPGGSIGTGPLAVNADDTITSVVNIGTGNNQPVTSLSGSFNGSGTIRVNIAAGATLNDSQTTSTVFPGAVNLAAGASPASGGTLTMSGAGGSLELQHTGSLDNNSNINVTAGTLRFNVPFASPVAVVGSSVTATISNAAVLELAGGRSALSDGTGTHSVNIVNNSTAQAGLHVTGANQQVGAIDGTGSTTVEANASLVANHIVQGALIIGGTDATHLGIVTIDASDANGNPLTSSGSGLSLAGSLAPSDSFGSGAAPASNFSGASDETASAAIGASASGMGTGSSSAVPEPSTILLLVVSLAAIAGRAAWTRRSGGR